MTTTTDYTGRKKDISIFQYPDAAVVGAQDVAVGFGKYGRFCAGVQKTAQRYAIILLTNVTSQPAYPTFGTSFMYTLQGGISPVDQIYARQIFTLANYKAVMAIKEYQATRTDIPTDEQLTNATLNNLSLYGGYVAFDVKIDTEAGGSIDFLVPLPK